MVRGMSLRKLVSRAMVSPCPWRSEDVEPVVKHRSFDPATRTLKKHTNDEDVEMDDTVEHQVDGLAEKIIAEDAERRAQDLVCLSASLSARTHVPTLLWTRTCSTSLQNGQTGT